jgi:hypothetical protein
MYKKILKNILLYLSIATSLLGIIFPSFFYNLLVYNGIINYYDVDSFVFEFKTYHIFINLLYCIIGIILFIIYIIKNKVKFLKKYLLLIPSIMISILLIYILIIFVFYHYEMDVEIPIIVFIIGSPLFLFYYLNQDNKFILLILLCLVYPISIIISLSEFMGVIGL